jgi:hypothetical protein
LTLLTSHIFAKSADLIAPPQQQMSRITSWISMLASASPWSCSSGKASIGNSLAETTIKAQLINRFHAVKIKIRTKAFALALTTPKKSRNMSHFFLVGTFFLRHSEEVSVDPFTSTVCDRLNTDDEHDSHRIRQNSGSDLPTLLP